MWHRKGHETKYGHDTRPTFCPDITVINELLRETRLEANTADDRAAQEMGLTESQQSIQGYGLPKSVIKFVEARAHFPADASVFLEKV